MCLASIQDIKDFLFKFKFFAQNIRQFTFLERSKNLNDLAELGINIYQSVNIILELTYKNYCKGPEKDTKYTKHNVWIFGYDLNGEEIYIKLSDNFNNNIAKCISFHKAEYKLNYPYK